jgi:hypothetical protein
LFIILFQQDGADEACNRRLIGEDADDVGTPLDLAIESLDRTRRRRNRGNYG